MSESERVKIQAFLAHAFNADQGAEILSPEETVAVVRRHRIMVTRLRDSKRGVFYVGTFKPRPDNPDSHA